MSGTTEADAANRQADRFKELADEHARTLVRVRAGLIEAEAFIASGRTHLGHSKLCTLIRELERGQKQ